MSNPGRPRKCDPRVEDLRSNIRLGDYGIAKTTVKEFGIDATDGDGRTALINSVIENKVDFIHWLVDNGANVNHQDRIGYCSLHFAGQNLLVDVAKYLLSKGANPNLQDKHGNPPLWTAIFESRGKDTSIVKLLLKFNASPDLINKYEMTPRNMYQNHYGQDISTLDLN